MNLTDALAWTGPSAYAQGRAQDPELDHHETPEPEDEGPMSLERFIEHTIHPGPKRAAEMWLIHQR